MNKSNKQDAEQNSVYCLYELSSNPEDRGSTFLRNVGEILTNYRVSLSRRITLERLSFFQEIYFKLNKLSAPNNFPFPLYVSQSNFWDIRRGADKSLAFPISLFAPQPKEFFLDGLNKLEQRSHKCVELRGEYVE
jgi:hypothetical protein